MQSGYIDFKTSRIHYSILGRGPAVLLCLHGYGESEKSFHFLEKYLDKDFTILAIDLPYHGKTQWKETSPITIDELVNIINTICTIHMLPVTNMQILAYSMGGRVALNLLEIVPGNLSKTVLLAPDGMKVNFWYWLATQSYVGIKLFRFTMHYPYWLFLLLRIGNVFRLINPGIYKFIRYYIHDKEVRQQLYNRWICMRKIKPSLKQVKINIQQHAIPLRLLYGKYDRIIRFERAEKFRKGLEAHCIVQVIPTGHQLLHEKHAEFILNLLQS